MADTQDKDVNQGTVDHQQQPQQGQPPMYALQQPSQYTVGYPPLYPYAPPPQDPNGHPADPNTAPGTYMMAFPPPPPGMIYAYPTAQGYAGMPFAPGVPLPSALTRPKRKQVKMACTNCAAACKRCDEGRPCERCCKYGVAETCINGQRKERKKGIKRGPYKRKGKVTNDSGYEGFTPEQGSQEGFYQPYFYPPPGFVAVGPDGQPVQGDLSGAQQGMQQPQYYSLQPYPPFAFPHGATGGYPVMPGHMLPPPGSSGTETDGESAATGQPPPMTAATDEDNGGNTGDDVQANGRGKKRRTGTTTTANSRDDQSTSKRAGKRTATNGADIGTSSSLAGAAGGA